ncbi:MAG: DEAD/DEAH box helicase family protein [Pseudoflavonifractor sp.]|nr:DEAD/DEAH box helicase family protein [Pseudoflavonifractor sp.]
MPTTAEQRETVEECFEQLSLFDTVEDAPTAEERQFTLDQFFPAEKLPQEVIDAFLKRGGNEEGSALRICAHYQENWSGEDNLIFLRREFFKGGRGLLLDGKAYAAWFDADGMKIATGHAAQHIKCAELVTWEQMDARIQELLDAGLFLSQKEMDTAMEQEARECSYALCNLQPDIAGGGYLQGQVFNGWYPEKYDRVASALADPEQLASLVDEMDRFMAAYQQDRSILQVRHIGMNVLRDRLHGLQHERRTFTEAPAFLAAPETGFITEDEIDEELRRGGGYENSKFRIYAHLCRGCSGKELAAHLKGEYGTGGHSPALNASGGDEWHDPKGIRLRRGGCEDVLLNWNKVAKRILSLHAAGSYMETAELAQIPAYEKSVLTTAVYHFYSGLPNEIQRPFPKGEDYYAAVKEIRPLLEDPEAVEKLVSDLENAFQSAAPEDRLYESRKETLRDMAAFRNGTFSLFSRAASPAPAQSEPMPKPKAEGHDILDDVDPAAIRANLEQSGIVNGEVVDEEKLNNSPFIRQVMADVERISREEQPAVKNFRITDDHLGEGGPKTKFATNIAAIETVKRIETEKRPATPEEQDTLSRFVGWGGLSDAFDPDKEKWAKEYAQLKELLPEEEYKSARASVLNAHYTSPTVIRAMYKALGGMGFHNGNILEPGVGVGNFFGLLPEDMAGSRLYGAEIDPVTGQIAKALYPNAQIQVKGFERTNWPDNFFDAAVGNVPFGAYSVDDPRYNKLNLHIHDYFFVKSIDQVRPGGVIAFVTSRYTMDKKNSTVRTYLAERCELLGAIRLPNNAFWANAGTEVTADILFLQKRERSVAADPDWVHVGLTPEGYTVNQYFVDHPEMILGTLTVERKLYGSEDLICKPFPDADLRALLDRAVRNIHGEITAYTQESGEEDQEPLHSIPADPDVRNYSFALKNGNLYFRENSRMNPVETSMTGGERIRGMIGIRDAVRELIDAQMENCSDTTLHQLQNNLNGLYDSFTARYGLLNSRGNQLAFSNDSSYPLLCALEILDEDGYLERKADMFSKRTIHQERAATHAGTAAEAMAICIGDRARVDLGYMSSLLGRPGDTDSVARDLRGVIFRDPAAGENPLAGWQTADEYLSGNVRQKLKLAEFYAEQEPERYAANVEALRAAQPKDLEASEIGVRLGVTWIPPEDYRQFVFDLVDTPESRRRQIQVVYAAVNGTWNVSGKNADSSNNVKAYTTYGTSRINAYEIIQDSLNLRDVKIFDTVTEDGNEKRVLNKKQTILAQQKQAAVRQAFRDWIWQDPERRQRLTSYYNEHFNDTRPREYDGSHIHFNGMNPEIHLRKHQQDAVARILYGGNTLLAHVVGAGKTWTMAAAAMESKRLGLCQKSLFVVPSHLTEQWGAEFLQLYPAANILVATKKDFEKANRKKFCARIATGDYDAVILGHSQFEKIPMSLERQQKQLERQIAEIEMGISDMRASEDAPRYTIKQMEYTRKNLEDKLKKLTSTERKDDVITFEELGVDRLFVDEAHLYKNLFLYTKMRNVAGISQTEAQKSSDLYMKCLYMDELTALRPGGPGRGVIFATGTPVSNSMTELYTMMRYMQDEMLQRKGWSFFDSWAAQFGETVTAIELSPEGTGYRQKTRFARFYNLPELMNYWKEVTDIQTSEMLKLPVPRSNYHTVVVQPTQLQQEMVKALGERAEAVRRGDVEPNEDNMLSITNDGRNLALDQRQINPDFPDDPGSKVNACAENIFKIWSDTETTRSAQMVFCDLSTPKGHGKIGEDGRVVAAPFSVYTDIRDKLIARGVPEQEVAFIHDANTDIRKADLFAKVRAGQVRVLLGSTAKMGAGTNAQRRLVALHHVDVPWRPSDIEQREGRILRQGNLNPEVDIYRYVTEATFDAYSWQTIETKQKFIGQIMTSKSPARSCEDVDTTALSYAEVKALAAGNPKIKERMDLEVVVANLTLARGNYQSEHFRLEDQVLKSFPVGIAATEASIAAITEDLKLRNAHAQAGPEDFLIEIAGKRYRKKEQAGTALASLAKTADGREPVLAGTYRGFQLELSVNLFLKEYSMGLRGSGGVSTAVMGSDALGNITRLNNVLDRLDDKLKTARDDLAALHTQMENAKAELARPWPQELEWKQKSERLAQLDVELSAEVSDSSQAEPVEEDEAELEM